MVLRVMALVQRQARTPAAVLLPSVSRKSGATGSSYGTYYHRFVAVTTFHSLSTLRSFWCKKRRG